MSYTLIYPDAISLKLIRSIRPERKRMGLRIHEISDVVGVNCSVFGRYERGKAFPSLSVLIKLAEFFGYDLSKSINYKFFHGRINLRYIRERLKKYGITHRELSQLSGYSVIQIQSTLYKNEGGSLSCLGAICEVLEREHKAYSFKNRR